MCRFTAHVWNRVMHIFLKLIGSMLALCLLSACASAPRGDIAYAPADMPVPIAAAAVVNPDDAYRLMAQDEVQITVFRVPDLSGTYRVGSSGTVGMPLIGEFAAVGRTAPELARALEQAYGARLLQDPSIQVQVVKSTGARFVIEGAVRSPGTFPVDSRTTLIEAVALANGLDLDTANPGRVVVIRNIGSEVYRAAFDLRQVREGLMPNPRIYAGDIVVVDGSTLRRDFRDIIRTVPLLGLFLR